MDEDKGKKLTSIPVSSFDDEKQEPAVDSADTSNNAVDVQREPVPQPAELQEDAVSVEAEPASAVTNEPSREAEQSTPATATAAQPEPVEQVDWAKRAEAEPATPVAVAIPNKHSHLLRNVLVTLMVLVVAGVAVYAVYAFAMPKNQAANDSVQTIQQTDITPAPSDPLSTVESLLADEITDESTAVEEQTVNRAKSVDEVSKETSEVSGAYDESNF